MFGLTQLSSNQFVCSHITKRFSPSPASIVFLNIKYLFHILLALMPVHIFSFLKCHYTKLLSLVLIAIKPLFTHTFDARTQIIPYVQRIYMTFVGIHANSDENLDGQTNIYNVACCLYDHSLRNCSCACPCLHEHIT